MSYVGAMLRKSRPDEPKTQETQPDPAQEVAAEDSSSGKPEKPERPDPTRYGDWEIDGRCIDF